MGRRRVQPAAGERADGLQELGVADHPVAVDVVAVHKLQDVLDGGAESQPPQGVVQLRHVQPPVAGLVEHPEGLVKHDAPPPQREAQGLALH